MTASRTRVRSYGRDFSKKRYGNPMFPNRPKQRSAGGLGLSNSGRFKLVLVVAGILAVLWYLIWGPVFGIENTDIQADSRPSEEIIRKAVTDRINSKTWLILPQKNVILFDKDGLIEDIEASVYLEELAVSKKLPDGLRVSAKEKSVKAVLLTDNRFLALDGSGSVVRELSSDEIDGMVDLPPGLETAFAPALGAESMEVKSITAGDRSAGQSSGDIRPVRGNANIYPLIVDTESIEGLSEHASVKARDTAYVQPEMSLVLQANSRLPDVTGRRVLWFSVETDSGTVKATMEGDWDILLTTTLPFDTQAGRLSLVIKEKIGQRKDALDYIDLRYNERIFFRFKVNSD